MDRRSRTSFTAFFRLTIKGEHNKRSRPANDKRDAKRSAKRPHLFMKKNSVWSDSPVTEHSGAQHRFSTLISQRSHPSAHVKLEEVSRSRGLRCKLVQDALERYCERRYVVKARNRKMEVDNERVFRRLKLWAPRAVCRAAWSAKCDQVCRIGIVS
ncbi:hypothetical protein MPTK1_1g26340 [Marchantia polymorpha subsp. ruderalis]|uniref:Uncharacterized protein n=2 Tax=Marchantia polymorpha TaxID=3197 RepID=A0AAF6AUH1_MARPO|nr:hypothetical protein MARPO_0002s0244 [Marchantia polymorpha]BBN00092.1 hypothetical protein Mp_1g26340 [Marchantia polymorpha subsp. ruderalis]|eukprot:PTQ49793.1 hypothetical protein MARPO_0002s0244 [Marchantia polymorpha]